MLLDELNNKEKITVVVTQPLCIYSKTPSFYSECWDNYTHNNLEPDNIDDSYGLNVVKTADRIDVYIPKNVKCILTKTNSNIDCTIIYKKIECDLLFEDEPIDRYFDIVKE